MKANVITSHCFVFILIRVSKELQITYLHEQNSDTNTRVYLPIFFSLYLRLREFESSNTDCLNLWVCLCLWGDCTPVGSCLGSARL